MRLELSAALAFFAGTSFSIAAQPINMFGMSGTCEGLQLGDTNITGACKDNILQIAYDDGRVGLYVFAGDKIFTFSGASNQMIDDQIHQDIDMMLLANSGNDPIRVSARGSCIYDNPFAGAAKFACTAKMKSGETVSLVFVTDGNDPVDEMAD